VLYERRGCRCCAAAGTGGRRRSSCRTSSRGSGRESGSRGPSAAAEPETTWRFDQYATDWFRRWSTGTFGEDQPHAATVKLVRDWALRRHLLPALGSVPLDDAHFTRDRLTTRRSFSLTMTRSSAYEPRDACCAAATAGPSGRRGARSRSSCACSPGSSTRPSRTTSQREPRPRQADARADAPANPHLAAARRAARPAGRGRADRRRRLLADDRARARAARGGRAIPEIAETSADPSRPSTTTWPSPSRRAAA
jgi:hypothetical protein